MESVDNHPELEELFKRSISPEGEIVYYPILLEPREWNDQPQTCSETLTVQYTDGSSETLTAEPFQLYGWENSVRYKSIQRGDERIVLTELRETEGVPVFEFDACQTSYTEEIVAGAAIKDAPIAMLDLRTNGGGNSTVVDRWVAEYCGQTLPGNMTQYSFNVFYGPNNSPSKWVEHENILVVLTGKYSASSAESLVDKIQDLENVLLIGENTGGYFLTSAFNKLQLPNSLVSIVMGDGLTIPAYEGEELAAKLIQHLSQ